MATEQILQHISIIAAADLSTKQFTFVKMTSTGANTAGVGDTVIGVQRSGSSTVAGQPCQIAVAGQPKVLVGTGPINPGDKIKCDANGKAVTASAADAVAGNVVGVAVSLTARATGEYVDILLYPNFTSALSGSETVNASGALSLTKRMSFIDSSGGVLALTLGDGLFDGQLKDMLMITAGNNAVVTPVSGHFANPGSAVSTATFNAAADWLQLVWDAAATKWRTVNSVSITFA